MKYAAILAMAALPTLVSASDYDKKWKLEEKESIRKTFDVGSSSGKKLLVDTVHGYIHVTGYNGSQVQVAVEQHILADSQEAVAEAKRDVKLDTSQQGSFVRLYQDGPFRTSSGMNYRGDNYYGYRVVLNFDIQVPFDTELVLKTVNMGDIQVRKTTGDYTISGLNGGIEMEGIEGSGNVQTLNGQVKVTYSRNPRNATQFKTLNGSLDVYFRDGLNADLKFKKLNGGIFTDFDVSSVPQTDAGDSRNGKFVYRSGGTIRGRTGNGGPELSFETLNGSIRLHSKGI